MTYEKLRVYTRSYELALAVHKFSLKLPNEFQADLGSQIRCLARKIVFQVMSVTNRFVRLEQKKKELRDAISNNEKLIFSLQLIHDLKTLPEKMIAELLEGYQICVRQLAKLLKALGQNQQENKNRNKKSADSQEVPVEGGREV